jgi:hypothetical protein
MFSDFPLKFSYGSFKGRGLTLRFLMDFELICVQGKRLCSIFQSTMCEYPVFPRQFVAKAVLSPMYAFGSFVKNQMAVTMWVYFWDFSYVSLIYRSAFVPIP